MRRLKAAIAALVLATAMGGDGMAADAPSWGEEFIRFCPANFPDLLKGAEQARAGGYHDVEFGDRNGLEEAAALVRNQGRTKRLLTLGRQINAAKGSQTVHCMLRTNEAAGPTEQMLRDWVGIPGVDFSPTRVEFTYAQDPSGRRIPVTESTFAEAYRTYGGVALLAIEREGRETVAMISYVAVLD